MRSFQRSGSRTMPAVVIALASVLSCTAPCFAVDAGDEDPSHLGPIGGGGTVQLEPVEPGPPARTRRLVFACVGDGVPVTFSDRPCGPAAITRELNLSPAAAPQSVTLRLAPAPRAATGPAAGRASERPRASGSRAEPRADARVAQCVRLEEAVASLDQHMRAGYSARESARLWARWREAKERLRKSGC